MDGLSDIGQLSGRISSRFEALSPQLRNAARYLLDHPDDVALRSMRDIAQAAGLPAVTFVRLTRALGFADYAELRNLFQNRLREANGSGNGGRPYSLKARDLQRRGGTSSGSDGGDSAALLKELFGAEMDNVQLTYEKNHPEALTKAVELIEGAARVCILGQRSCYPIAFFFAYVYRLFRTNAVLLQSGGGMVLDELRGIGRNDLLIAISMAPYSTETVRAARFTHDEGARLLALTDDPLSPIARIADRTLLVAPGTPSFFHSIVSPIALVQALLALLVARGGKDALAAIERSERQLERFQAYWPDEGSPQSGRSR
ncbi:MAG TPA: MurR/RpiR family transcriptional regulator [Stellaceae bacterium]|jgi:DNA-binding MurR/RpiR family transcriptional regulator